VAAAATVDIARDEVERVVVNAVKVRGEKGVLNGTPFLFNCSTSHELSHEISAIRRNPDLSTTRIYYLRAFLLAP
jgi:hypothetical protein